MRRVRKGDSLPRINSMVDVCNWCSLEFQLPYGLYDAAHIDGDVELRIGLAGESYPGIRKDAVHVDGRIALADRMGPFGNPTSDSARTMVTTATTRPCWSCSRRATSTGGNSSRCSTPPRAAWWNSPAVVKPVELE